MKKKQQYKPSRLNFLATLPFLKTTNHDKAIVKTVKIQREIQLTIHKS